MKSRPVRFAAIGVNHGHIYGQTDDLLHAGAELVTYYAPEPDLAATYGQRYPQAPLAHSAEAVLENESIDLIISAGIPCDRAPLGVRAMRHGKDYMTDKPGAVTLAQLDAVRRVQKETGRIYSIYYAERLAHRATVKASELVKAGAIGEIVQVAILAPHRVGNFVRPPWFFDPAQNGGILTDIGSHQFDQFLYFTGASEVEIVASQVANFHHPAHPRFEDFGDVLLRSDRGCGYLRLDWFTPGGLGTWGDGRLVLLGTDGTIEVRKNVDIAGRPGDNHLFLVDQKKTEYINCQGLELPYAAQLIDDILNRTETAMAQEHCFRAMELALRAQKQAVRLGHLMGENSA
ncbi:MAG: Gfo/Idh/MocA family oxidoreductase [Caldilineaceae bacterium]|nr:Gfo/Idh/MocA family oxidoreductase [Caldilineaceae bacterium]